MRRISLALISVALLGLVVVGTVRTRAASKPRNDFHFAIVGDRGGTPAPQVYGRAWREVSMLAPDFAINVGDSITGGPGKDNAAESMWAGLRPLLRRYSAFPFYFTPGNHDIWSDLSKKLYERETGRPPFYSFNFQDAHFTVLDTSRTDALGEDQIKFLENDLRKNRNRDPKFIFFHKPYWIALLKLQSGDFPLHKLARQYGVDYVVSGHGHRYLRMERDGIVYTEIGSSGAVMGKAALAKDAFQNGKFFHFAWVRVKGDAVSITIKELEPPSGSGRMFRAEEWNDQGPRFDPADPGLNDKPET
ncbi:MAG: metallophosphoesterase [Bryobacteraceae bacterium]